jgi:hypothetical protein
MAGPHLWASQAEHYSLYVCTYVCMFVRMYVCLYVCVCVCVCVFITFYDMKGEEGWASGKEGWKEKGWR